VLREAIVQLKYEDQPAIATILAERLAETWLTLNWPDAMVVPVPTTAKRLRERGYNQAALLARACAHLLGLPYRADVLRRSREIDSQVGKTREARLADMHEAFTASLPQAMAGQPILLIDDVLTTGATLSACAAALHQAGAVAVYGLTVSAA
jgi:ComF family protein